MTKSKKLLAVICTIAMVATMFSSLVAFAADIPAATVTIEYKEGESTDTNLVFDITTDAQYVKSGSVVVNVSEIMANVPGSSAVQKRNAIKNASSLGASTNKGSSSVTMLASNKFKVSIGGVSSDDPFDYTSDSLVAKMVIPLTAKLESEVTIALDESTFLEAGVEDEESDAGFSYVQQYADAGDMSLSAPVKVGGTPSYEVIDPAITGITVTPETAKVKGGETVTFAATVEGTDGQDAEGNVVPFDKTVTWSENAPEGVFTAPAATEEEQVFTVTATAADGKTATATVTVEAEEVIVPETTVTVTDAKATQSDPYKDQNTMYWGVKIVNGMQGDVNVWMTADEEQSKVTTLTFEDVTINGDVTFGIFTKVGADRLEKAIALNVQDVAANVVGTSSAAAYSSLN